MKKKYKIITEILDVPIQEGIIVRGPVTFHVCHSIGDCEDTECKPVKISLKELSSKEPPNINSYADLKGTNFKKYSDDFNKYQEHLKFLQTLECSEELQLLLIEKLNEGITEI